MSRHLPEFAEFSRLFAQTRDADGGGPLIPVYREMVADSLTPVSAYARIAKRGGPSFLFESVIGGEKVGRYSFLGSGPFSTFEARGNRVVLSSGLDPTRTAEQVI